MRKAEQKIIRIIQKKIWKICKDKPISLEVFADNFLEIKKQALQIKKTGLKTFMLKFQ